MSRQPEVDWARTADFGEPLRWGEVERQILARPAPRFEPGEYDGPLTARKVVGLPGLATMLVGLLLAAAPVVGLVLVVPHTSGAVAGNGLLTGAFWAFVAAAVIVMLAVLTWVEEHRKASRATLVGVGVTAAAATAAYVVGRSGSAAYADGALPWLVLGVALAGWVVLAVIGFGSRSWARHTAARDRPDQTEEGAGYMAAQVAVLEILVRRGLVERDQVDVTEMMEMPLGSWHELDPER